MAAGCVEQLTFWDLGPQEVTVDFVDATSAWRGCQAAIRPPVGSSSMSSDSGVTCGTLDADAKVRHVAPEVAEALRTTKQCGEDVRDASTTRRAMVPAVRSGSASCARLSAWQL
jgi:hypothetical protein